MSHARAMWIVAGRAALIVGATGAVLSIALAAGGHPVGASLAAFWRGALGSPEAFVSATLVRATPLILAGLAVSLAFSAGVWNIGAEGQLLAGAAGATAVALLLGGLPAAVTLPLVIGAGACIGAAWAWIAAALRRWRGVLEVIATIMLNFIALHLVGYLVRGPLQEPLGIYPQSATLPDAAVLPRVAGRLHLGFPLAVAACAIAWVFLRWTAAGFRVRAAGANPAAARVAGAIDVERVAMRAFVLSGALAGVAGAVEVSGVTLALYESLSPGYGYVAIAVALLARLHPLGVIASGVLFGALEAGGAAMQRDAGVPSVLVTTVGALLILGAVLTGALRRARRPAEAAEPGPRPQRAAA